MKQGVRVRQCKEYKVITNSKHDQIERIKVVHVLHSVDYGGIETIIINWLLILDKESFDIQLVCFANPDKSEQLFIDTAKDAGFDVKTIPWSRSKPVISSSRELMKILKPFKADIVHTHNLYADLVGLIAGKLCGCKLVSSLYVWADFGWKRNLLQYINQFILKRFDLVTAQCIKTLDASKDRGLKQDRLRVLHSGFSIKPVNMTQTERSEMRARYGAKDEHIVLANVARLYPEKAQDILLEQFKEINNKFPQTRLWMLGRGPLEIELKAKCTELGLDDVVRFTGFISELADFLYCVDMQVHPSHAEGIPMAILSGMSSKLPIIASSVGGIPEVLDHNINGILVPPASDPKFNVLFLDAITRLMEHPDHRNMLARNAQYFIRNDYSLEKAASNLENLYKELLI